MSESEHHPVNIEALTEGLANAKVLAEILDTEFSLLNSGNIDSFERLQSQKSDTLNALSDLIPLLTHELEKPDTDDPIAQSTVIEEIKDVLAGCRDAHLKNAILIDRKIESTRSALEVLRSSQAAETVETYDQLGRIRRGYGRGRQTEV